MTTALDLDLQKLKARAFDRALWAEGVLRRSHAPTLKFREAVATQMLASPTPPTELWPPAPGHEPDDYRS
jgi:hypothetical protein